VQRFGNIAEMQYLCSRLKKSCTMEYAPMKTASVVWIVTNIIHQNNKTMYLDKAKKEEIFGKYGKSTTDTGSAEAQIALFSYRISHLTEHLKKNHKDHSTARSLTMLVGKRRKLLKYLYNNDINRYRAIIKALGLRK
jgi:small subunit ribosomal protein S15